MKASNNFIKQLEELYQMYEEEIKIKTNDGFLAPNTSKTYLLHSGNFVKWCRDEFVPGFRNKAK